MIEPAGRPFPIFGFAHTVIVIDLLHFPGVFNRELSRTAEIGEDIISRPMPARPPFDRITMIAHSSYASHDRIEVRHFERNVVEIGVVVEAQHQAVMVGIAPDETELPRLIRKTEAESLSHEIERCIIVPAIQIDVR